MMVVRGKKPALWSSPIADCWVAWGLTGPSWAPGSSGLLQLAQPEILGPFQSLPMEAELQQEPWVCWDLGMGLLGLGTSVGREEFLSSMASWGSSLL